jgi:hypothetical protein
MRMKNRNGFARVGLRDGDPIKLDGTAATFELPPLSHLEFLILAALDARGELGSVELRRALGWAWSAARWGHAMHRLFKDGLARGDKATMKATQSAPMRSGWVLSCTRKGRSAVELAEEFYRSARPAFKAAKIPGPGAYHKVAVHPRPRVLEAPDMEKLKAVAPEGLFLFLQATVEGSLTQAELAAGNLGDASDAGTLIARCGPRSGHAVELTAGMRAIVAKAAKIDSLSRVFSSPRGRAWTKDARCAEFGSAAKAAGLGDGRAWLDERGSFSRPTYAENLRLCGSKWDADGRWAAFRLLYRAFLAKPERPTRPLTDTEWLAALETLRWNNVDLEGGTIGVQIDGRPSRLAVGDALNALLRDALQARDASPLFPTFDGKRWNNGLLKHFVRKYARRAGIKDPVTAVGVRYKRAGSPAVRSTLRLPSSPSPIVASTANLRLLADGTLYIGADRIGAPKPTPAMQEMLVLLAKAGRRLLFKEIGGTKGHRVLVRIRDERPDIAKFLDWPDGKKGAGWGAR